MIRGIEPYSTVIVTKFTGELLFNRRYYREYPKKTIFSNCIIKNQEWLYDQQFKYVCGVEPTVNDYPWTTIYIR